MVVTGRRLDLEDAVAELEHRHVERTAAEVEDEDRLVGFLVEASLVASRCALLKYAGTVMTASLTGSPRYASASDFSFCRIIALISGGA
jgi:hypothetical protein